MTSTGFESEAYKSRICNYSRAGSWMDAKLNLCIHCLLNEAIIKLVSTLFLRL
jgi:hypothetical protein